MPTADLLISPFNCELWTLDYGLANALQQVVHLLKQLFRWNDLIGSPKEGYVKPTLKRLEQFFLQPVRLAQLPFDTVPLHRTLEIALADGHHYAHARQLAPHENGTDRIG